jgi:hypothetical protein
MLISSAQGAEWQWSAPMGKGRAFLWVPPACKELRAVVVAQNNMIELGVLEHSGLRQALATENIGEVFIAPPFDFLFQFDKDAGAQFEDLMRRLAAVSGYAELEQAPIVPMGHSACASFPWNFAAWNPGRTLAVLSIHGDAPLTKFTGCGRPNPEWGSRSIDGVPGLMVMGEYEWGDSEHGVDRLSPALEFRRRHPQAAIAMLAEPGNGHFNYSDDLIQFIARFVRKAAESRLPKALPPVGRAPELWPVAPADGWLVERWHLNQPRKFKPAPAAKYQGDPAEAFWCFDQETAWATYNYMAEQPGKLPQLLSVTAGDLTSEKGCGEPVSLPFCPDSDGVTLRLKTAFMSSVPGDAAHNQNPARWAYTPAGSALGHAVDGGPIQLHTLSGPAVKVGDSSFQLSLNRVNWCNPERGRDIWVWASHPGDANYKSMVQQASIRVPEYGDGAPQHITFPAIPNQPVNAKSVRLAAVSDAGAEVYYYVAEGPAEVVGNELKFTRIPPRAKLPLKVTVVAWQHGLPGKVRGAEPVAREFWLTADFSSRAPVEAADKVRILGTNQNGFIHPGIGLTREMLESARAQVLAGREPWSSGFKRLAANPNSSKTVSCRNQSQADPARPDLDAFDSKSVEGRLRQDSDKAWRQALMYYFTGDMAYRSNAMKILRVWSGMNPDRFRAYSEVYIHASYPVRNLIQAAELLRYTTSPDAELEWSARDTERFSTNFVIPAVRGFFDDNGWFMNQCGYAMAAAMAGDIFISNQTNYQKRVQWFTVNPTAPNKGWSFSVQDLARLVVLNSATGEKLPQPQVQLVEMGRDQAHAGDDLEIFNTIVRMMNAQGTRVDPASGAVSVAGDAVGPYEFLNDRILSAADYFSRYMLGYDTLWVPVAYDISAKGEVRGIYPRAADNYRGRIREHDFWDAYYYYTCRKGIDVARKAPYYDEAFRKRIVSSDYEWVFIPKEAAGEAARVAPWVQEPEVVNVVERSTSLSSNGTVIREGDEVFLRVIPTEAGARLALLSCDTRSRTISLRVRTTGMAALKMAGFARPWRLPNTRGEWRCASYTMERFEHFGDIVFCRVLGDSQTAVDMSQLLREPGGNMTAPRFSSRDETLRRTAYVGAPVALDLSAEEQSGLAAIAYAASGQPEGSRLDSQTGAFIWKPKAAGEFAFEQTATAGKLASARRVQIVVAADRAAAVRDITAAFDPRRDYVASSVAQYRTVRAEVQAGIQEANDAVFFPLLMRLQAAVDALEPLTPLLADGSLDFPKVVASSNLGDSIALLADGNDDTFPVYSLAKDLSYIFDFGERYKLSASAFAMEGRLNFEDRMANAIFYGSNDGKTWTQLTPEPTRAAAELTRVPVAPEMQGVSFRFLRIQKQGGGLFEPAELRIFGRRVSE